MPVNDKEEKYLFISDDKEKSISQLKLTSNGVYVSGTPVLEIPYPEQMMVFQICISQGSTFFSSSSGIHEVSHTDPLRQVHTIHEGNVRGLLVSADSLVYVDADAYQVKMKVRNAAEPTDISHVAGSGRQASQDGSSKSASFAQPMILCREGKTLFLTDLAASKILMITPMEGTQMFLRSLKEMSDSMGVHLKGQKTQPTFESANRLLASVNTFFDEHREQAKSLKKIKKNYTNGPEGTVASATIYSVQLLQKGLLNCEQWISRFISEDDIAKIDMKVFLTTVVENLHAVSHMKHETFSTFEYAQDFGKIFKEAIKRSTTSGHHYFTKPESYYPFPEHSHSFKDIPQISPLPSKSSTKKERSDMRQWVKDFRPVRQRTVRGETTKDKSGMLPPAVYANTATTFTVRDLQPGQPDEVQDLILDDRDENEDERPESSESEEEQESEYESDGPDESDNDFASDNSDVFDEEYELDGADDSQNKQDDEIRVSSRGRTLKFNRKLRDYFCK